MDINYEIGHRYAVNGDYKEAYYYLKKSLKEGNYKAANDIGVMLQKTKRYVEAADMYRKAIELGCSGEANVNLGNLYENGLGVRQDYEKAREYYLKALDSKYPFAYAKMAKLYALGLGVSFDYRLTRKYITEGAKLEKEGNYAHVDCTFMLGYHHHYGLGVKRNEKIAFKLWSICANHGDLEAKYNIALFYLTGKKGVVEKDIDKAIKMLIDLAVTNKYQDAMLELSKIFEQGRFVKRNYQEAGNWLIDAARLGNVHAYLRIASIYLSGQESRYKFNKNYCNKAIVDFLSSTYGEEERYSHEYEVYKQLKEKYPDKVDWDYLETIPDFKKDKDIDTHSKMC